MYPYKMNKSYDENMHFKVSVKKMTKTVRRVKNSHTKELRGMIMN